MEDDSSDEEPEQLQCKIILLGDGNISVPHVPRFEYCTVPYSCVPVDSL